MGDTIIRTVVMPPAGVLHIGPASRVALAIKGLDVSIALGRGQVTACIDTRGATLSFLNAAASLGIMPGASFTIECVGPDAVLAADRLAGILSGAPPMPPESAAVDFDAAPFPDPGAMADREGPTRQEVKSLLDIHEASLMLNVPEQTVQRLALAGELFRVLRQDGSFGFPRDDLLRWSVSSPEAAKMMEPRPDRRTSLAGALLAGGLRRGVRGADKAAVLLSLAEHAFLPHGPPAPALFQGLMQREEELSTGLGGGVAVPHIRAPCFSIPAILLCPLAAPVDFDSVSGEKVDFLLAVFSTMAPLPHLQLLAKSNVALNRKSLRQRCARGDGIEELVALAREVDRASDQ